MNKTTERRIIVVNSRGAARIAPVVSHRQFVAHLPIVFCVCGANVRQDLAQPLEHCPRCGEKLLIF